MTITPAMNEINLKEFNMTTRFLARKVILSLDVAIFATVLMLGNHIQGQHWLWAMSATVLSFIAAETIQKRGNLMTPPPPGRAHRSFWVAFKSYLSSVWARITNVFTLDFLAGFVVINLAHYFSLRGIIEPGVWFPLVSGICGFYNVGNALSKKE